MSSSNSSSTSPSFPNNCSSSVQLRKKSRPYRLASPSQIITTKTNTTSSLSNDSLSEQSEQLSIKRRPRSAFTSYEQYQQNLSSSEKHQRRFWHKEGLYKCNFTSFFPTQIQSCFFLYVMMRWCKNCMRKKKRIRAYVQKKNSKYRLNECTFDNTNEL